MTCTAWGPTVSRAAREKTPTSGYRQTAGPLDGSRAGRGGQRGFTLLELLVVLVILGAVSVLVVPAIGSWRDDFVFKDAIGRLEAAMALARVEAMREGRAIGVGAVAGEGSLRVGGREISLGPGGRVLSLGPVGSPPSEEGGLLRFYPDGSADHGLIRLKGPRRTVDVVVNPLGGKSRIIWREG